MGQVEHLMRHFVVRAAIGTFVGNVSHLEHEVNQILDGEQLVELHGVLLVNGFHK